MKKGSLFVSALLAICSCVHEDSQKVSPLSATEDPHWVKLAIPTGRESFAIAGDIDKTLLVTTWTKAYFTTDQGKTWQQAKDFGGPVPGLLARKDTLFALKSYVHDQQGTLLGATNPQYFTTDGGKTWSWIRTYEPFMDEITPIGRATSSTGVGYFIQPYTTPVSPGATTAYINPSQIRKQNVTGQQTVPFPFKHRLLNLYLDPKNRLYVAASGGTYQPEHNSFYCCTDSMSAAIYVSRQPLP